MPLSRNPNAYRDIETILAAALRAGGATYECKDAKSAVRWVQRAYMYRKLLFEQAEAAAPPGYMPETPYDMMRLRRDGAKVEILFDSPQLGTLRGLDGTELSPGDEDEAVEGDDPLLDDALAFAKQLDEGEGE